MKNLKTFEEHSSLTVKIDNKPKIKINLDVLKKKIKFGLLIRKGKLIIFK